MKQILYTSELLFLVEKQMCTNSVFKIVPGKKNIQVSRPWSILQAPPLLFFFCSLFVEF